MSIIDQQFRSPIFGQARRNHEWTTFYMMDIPLPMQIYDFEWRYQDIEPDQFECESFAFGERSAWSHPDDNCNW